MNLLSILIGLLAAACGLVAFIPMLGWMYWLIIPIAIIGLIIGILSGKATGRNLNIAVIAIGFVRLAIGGGVI